MKRFIIQLDSEVDADDYLDDLIIDDALLRFYGWKDVRDASHEEKLKAVSEIEQFLIESELDVIRTALGTAILFSSEFKERYFAQKYKMFRKTVANISFCDYIGATDTEAILKLQNTIEQRDGLYVYHCETIYTMDSFVRSLPHTEQGTLYRVGGVLVYEI